MYFIIGDSGIGKSTLLNFFTSPFTEDPIKKGTIKFTHPGLVPHSWLGKKPFDTFKVNYSAASHSSAYFEFVRKHLAYIPQITSSFHPSKPLAEQLYDQYFWAAKKPSKSEFINLAEKLGESAGFDSVTVSDDLKQLHIKDVKQYVGTDRDGRAVEKTIVNIDRDVSFLNDEGLSTGQLQRLLVLSALIRFETIDTPVLFGDEFLVNFSFTEGDAVLRNIIRLFSQKKDKTAVFIFHDLSYPCIKALKDNKDINAKIVLFHSAGAPGHIEERNPKGKSLKNIKISRMAMKEFWQNSMHDERFNKFKKSYSMTPLEIDSGTPPSMQQSSEPIVPPVFERYSYPGKSEPVYNDLSFYIRRNKFIVLTGFSGCGKTTLCNNLIEFHIKNKNTFRYFPSMSHESLSFDSHVTVEEDLETMYGFYNRLWDLRDDKTAALILDHFKAVQFFTSDKTVNDYHDFLKKHIYDLSGGEMQRYWFARITLLVNIEIDQRPDLLVFDESISSLDCTTKDELLKYIMGELFLKQKFTILFVTHDLRDIGVVYSSFKKARINDCFEHYEMFDKQIYRVKTDYETYRINVSEGKYIDYETIENPGMGKKVEPIRLKRMQKC
jgi:ABC-type dipeptide/oligopeptide/nickel transport system ATPase subunit